MGKKNGPALNTPVTESHLYKELGLVVAYYYLIYEAAKLVLKTMDKPKYYVKRVHGIVTAVASVLRGSPPHDGFHPHSRRFRGFGLHLALTYAPSPSLPLPLLSLVFYNTP